MCTLDIWLQELSPLLDALSSSSTGGWVQPDEANTNFDILVNQLTEGHDYLLKNFGVRPRFAWQVRLPPSTVLRSYSLWTGNSNS